MSNIYQASKELQKATKKLKKLKGVSKSDVKEYQAALEASGAKVLQARASIIFIVFYGQLSVKVQTKPYTKWKYEVDSWGLGAQGGDSLGFMYTAYDNWDSFFKNVTSYHVQGGSAGGGFLQVNWFIKNGTPVGQFNGGQLGAGVIEAGGPGKWKS